jgi:hypothetical protein
MIGHFVIRQCARNQKAMARAPRIARFANAPLWGGRFVFEAVLEFP